MSAVDLGMPAVRPTRTDAGTSHPADPLRWGTPFPEAAKEALADAQLRSNLARATSAIRAKRAAAVGEVPDWEALREAGRAIKEQVMAHLPDLLVRLEEEVTARGGTVHRARDAAEANRIVTDLVRATGETEVVKVKSMVTQEIGLNEALADAGITAVETDLAELIVQLAGDRPSHILVPAIHFSRAQIREIFRERMADAPADLTDDPADLADAARLHLRRTFLRAKVAVSGANFAVAETGTLAVVESEGNGRMCLTLPETLITVMGIEKVIPTFRDLEVFLQLLPRSSTGERMNPYTSMWTGVTPGDGPQSFHLVLLDNGRTRALADEVGRTALHCIRCSACLNVCPVYERVGGHAYGSVYPGPIGAVLTPQLTGTAGHGDPNAALPYASTLCGACYDVCPVKIDIPTLLVELRARQVDADRRRLLPGPWAVAMRGASWAMSDGARFAAVERTASVGRLLGRRRGVISSLPFPGSLWTRSRDLPVPPNETFRDWWARTHDATPAAPAVAPAVASTSSPSSSAERGVMGRLTVHSTHNPAFGERAGGVGGGAGGGRTAPSSGLVPDVLRGYRTRGEHAPGSAEVLELLVDRLLDYRAVVHRVDDEADLPATLARLISDADVRSVVVPPWLPSAWVLAVGRGDVRVVTDVPGAPLGAASLDTIDAVVTAARVAIAETGTIVLDGADDQGRRAITLVPDRHVCIVRAHQVVQTVPEAVALLDRAPTRPLTWISGPSATSDIELTRVEGVHGPRILDVVLLP